MIQGSPEWFAVRAGKVTASRIHAVMAKTKSGWSADRANYMAALLTERLTGQKAIDYVNREMQWGTDTEPQARAAYAFYRDVDVQEIAFVEHPRIAMSGASPDGLVGDDGVVEFKCPSTANHIETLLGEPFDRRYVYQVQWQLACTDRKWGDLASFDPRLPEEMRLHVERFPRDDKLIAELERGVELFLSELDTKLRALKEKFLQEAA